MSLVKLVAIGTVIVTLLGAGLFAWLAWLLSHQSAPWRGDTGWWDWLEHVGGSELFDAARTTATILAVVGVGGAALVAYRRQDTAERAHQVAIDGQEIATSQHTLDSQKYQLDRDRQSHEQERDLRARFASVAEQLGATNYAVRHAGAYALASLADDWHRFGNDVERQVCVHLLCAQLRVPRVGSGMGAVEILPGKNPAEDREVRKTMITLIRSHRPVDTDVADNWKSCSLDLSGADLSEFDCSDIDLRSANLDDANLTGAVLVRSDLSKATMARANLSRANFLGATLTGAHLFSVHTEQLGEDDTRRNQVVFGGAGLKGVQLTSASLPHADFVLADLQGESYATPHSWEQIFRAQTCVARGSMAQP